MVMSVVKTIRKPNQACVEKAQELLDLAKSGDITDFMFTAKHVDGTRLTAWTGTNDLFSILASVTRAQHVIQRRLDEASTESSIGEG